jgi:hypothetical protein
MRTIAQQVSEATGKMREAARGLLSPRTADEHHFRFEAAGALLSSAMLLEVLDDELRLRDDMRRVAVAPADKPRAGKPRAAKAAGAEHRHKFVDGVCTVAGCGKAKGAGGRGNKRPDQPDAAARTVPMPLTAPERSVASLAAAAERYSGGGMGSSGTGDR